MWFGFGKSKGRFGQEEFCLCSGLKMGQLTEGFSYHNEVLKDSMLSRIFKGKRPTVEVLYATLSKITSKQSEDAYTTLSIYMVSQFFGIDDRRTTSIFGWLFSLVEKEEEFKKFPWGSYIFSFTLHFLKSVLNKRLSQLRGETKKKEKGQGKGKDKGGEEKKETKSKYYTYNLSGFSLVLQRIIRLDNNVGKRIGTCYPRFSRWEFTGRISDIESKFNALMALFPWEVETYEKGTDYFKSLNLKYVCKPLTKNKREKLALGLHTSEEEQCLGYEDAVDDYHTGNGSDGIGALGLKEVGCSVGRDRSTFLRDYSSFLRSVYSPMENLRRVVTKMMRLLPCW
ncbi:hypothetical protein Ddye_025455 [Dipteronia dyeriana]|uniref:DUF1985 domain-containing protein n=1 Tax=Dipteronia dyeriana TaxID=168575 RepID=A0AAD9TLE0_9ROSI|nr:hypothetical protein Ddye_025455 [Dipteronia dyeriana]